MLFCLKTIEQQDTFLKKFHNANISAHQELPADLSDKFSGQDSPVPCLSV